MRCPRLVLCSLALLLPAAAVAGDWPQILGPSRNGIAARDEQIADDWPAAGPPVVWRRDCGSGHAGLAVTARAAVLFHRVGDREVVEAVDPLTGKTLWSDGHPTTFVPQVGGGNGPLCVPLIQADRVITFGAQGVLSCHGLGDGRLLWRRDTHRDYAAPEGYFGAGSSPIVIGDAVIVNVGGSKREAGIVAFALESGATLWARSSEPASYSSPASATLDGEPHVVMITRYKCLLLEPRTGVIRWEFPFGMRGPTVNAAMPVIVDEVSKDGQAGRSLLVTAAYGIGSVAGTFDRDRFTPRWEGIDSLASQYCTPVVVGDHAYGFDGRDDVPPADFVCVEAATGRVAWREAGFGYGTLLAADRKLLAAKTDGELVLIKPTPDGISIVARAQPLAGTLRALPALAHGRLFIRDDSTVACLDLATQADVPASGL